MPAPETTPLLLRPASLPPPSPPHSEPLRPRPSTALHHAFSALLALSLVACAGFSMYTLSDLIIHFHSLTFLAASTRLALAFMLCTLPISLYDIAQHIARYEHHIQRLYVRIILLVPIYCVESYAALISPSAHFALETLRETYECVALLAVFWLAVETLGSRRDVVLVLNEGAEAYVARTRAEEEAAEAAAPGDGSAAEPSYKGDGMSRTERFLLGLLDGSAFVCGAGGAARSQLEQQQQREQLERERGTGATPTVRLMLPFCCFGRWKLGASFLHKCHLGVAQYVVVRLVCSITTLITAALGVYGDGLYDPATPSLWLTIAINTSQLWALYCLIFFAAVLWPALRPLKPLPKFLLVKVVVFGFWWQSVFLGILADAGALRHLEPSGGTEQAEAAFDAALVLQDALIAVECLLIAVAHHYTFGVHDFLRPDMQWSLSRRARRRAARAASSKPGSSSSTSSSDPPGSPFSPLLGAQDVTPHLSVGSDLLMLDVASDSAAVMRAGGQAAADALRALALAAASSPRLLRRGLLSSEPREREAGGGAVVPGEGAGLAPAEGGGARWALGLAPGAQV